MIVFKDLLTGDEMLTDAYKLGSEADDFLLTCCGKMCQQKLGAGISADLIGGNPSQEDDQCDDQCDDEQVQSGLDVVMQNRLKDISELFGCKKDFDKYLRKWAKNVAQSDELKGCPDKLSKFKTGCQKSLANFRDMWTDDVTVYAGEKFDPEDCKSSVMIAKWNDDGLGVVMYGIRLGFEEEKC